MIKKWYKKVLLLVRWVLTIFYVPHLFSCCRKQINALPKETQLFLMTRCDFGTFIFLALYARHWEETRGKTCLLILSPYMDLAKEVTKKITPTSKLISLDRPLLRWMIKKWGEGYVYEELLCKVYFLLLGEFPRSLYLFQPGLLSTYQAVFDLKLKNLAPNISATFRHAYQELRLNMGFHEDAMQDFYHLQNKASQTRRIYFPNSLEKVKAALGISDNFVVINLNCKDYQNIVANRRGIQYPERYNVLIDVLIERGFSVVIQGRKEQPLFAPRQGLVDYAKSAYGSVENDLALYSGCSFAVSNKTGGDSFCAVCNTPQLGLDYTDSCILIPNTKLRFFPKSVRHAELGRDLTWKELLSSPSFFNIFIFEFGPRVTYHDLEEEDLVAALEEFLPLLSLPDENWADLSPQQQEYRDFLHPLHLDLYVQPGVPCTTYLKKSAV